MKGSWNLKWSKERVFLQNPTTEKKWTYELAEPPYCLHCGRSLVRGSFCWDDIRHQNLQFTDKTFQLGTYYPTAKVEELQPETDILTQHILGLKSDHEYAQPIGEAMAMSMINNYREMLDADLMIPIPSYDTNENHTNALCNVISEHIQKTMGKTIDVQTGITKTTSTKLHMLPSGTAREEVINEMFVSNDNMSVIGKNVILVDDLLTRGDAKNKCTRIVKLKGATKIWIYVTAGT